MKTSSPKRTAIYPGSFDPMTIGHLDVIERAAKMFDHLIVGVGRNTNKQYLLPTNDRVKLVQKSIPKEYSNVSVKAFDGLLIDFAKKENCRVIVRGLRVLADFEYEFSLGLTNMHMDNTIETIFLLTNPKHLFVSSSMVKDVIRNKGDIRDFVPFPVERYFFKKTK